MTSTFAVSTDGTISDGNEPEHAFGSTLDIDCPPSIGIDPGAEWTGIVARHGSAALNGTVIGLHPGRKLGNAERAALDLDDHDMWHDYYTRVCGAIDVLWDTYWDGQRVRVVVEGMDIPRRPNARTRHRVPMTAWLPVRELVAAIVGRYMPVIVVDHDHLGVRHQTSHGGSGDWRAYYPPVLYGARPASWLGSDHPSNLRDHERAAYDAAGVAHILLAE